MNSSIHKSLYARMKTSKLQLAVCNITGILISIDIPFIPGKILSYENPLARIENAREIAYLEYKEQCKISPHILSGVLLTILNHYELIEDHLSSTERNSILSTVPSYHLCELMKLISSYSRRRISLLPRLSLASTSTEYSQPTQLIINYIQVCTASTLPTLFEDMEISRAKNLAKIGKVSKLSVESSTRKEIKNLITGLIGEGVLSSKVITILKLVSQGDNLATLNDSLRDKLVDKLKTVESDRATRLASILSSSSKSLTSAEQAFKQEYDSALDTLTSDLPAYRVRKSLKEILAEKNAIKTCEAVTRFGDSSCEATTLRVEQNNKEQNTEESSIESSAKPSALHIDEIEPIEQNIESSIEKQEKTSSFLESLKEIQEELIYEEDSFGEDEEEEEYNENEEPSLSFQESFDPDEF